MSTAAAQTAPPGYRNTEAGVIPDDWEVRPLLTTLRIANGQVDPRIEPYKSMVLVAPDHIEGQTGRLLKSVAASEQNAISGKYLFNEGDIIYSKIRPYLRKVFLADFQGLCSADMYPLSAAEDVEPSFMAAVLLGHDFSKFAENSSARSGIPKINREELADYNVAIPPLPEQRAIAAALSDVDELISSLDALIEKKRAVKTAAMQQLLTGKRRLPGFDGEWETRRLGELATLNMGQSPSSLHYNSRGIGLPLIQGNADIVNRKTVSRVWTTQITKQCRANEILLTVRAPVGYVGVASVPSCLGRGVCAINASGVGRSYLFYALVHGEPKWKLLEQGSTFTAANSDQISKFELDIPTSREEQTAIASVLSEMDAELAALEARREKTRKVKTGMMQELLTGRTRLV